MHTTLSVLIEQWFDRQPIVPRCERSIDFNIVIYMFHHDVPACITVLITGLFALSDVQEMGENSHSTSKNPSRIS